MLSSLPPFQVPPSLFRFPPSPQRRRRGGRSKNRARGLREAFARRRRRRPLGRRRRKQKAFFSPSGEGKKGRRPKLGRGPLSFSFYILPERKKNVRRPSPMRYKVCWLLPLFLLPPASFPPSHIPRGDKNRCLFLPSLLRLTSGFLFSERQEIPCLPRFDTFQKRKNSQR